MNRIELGKVWAVTLVTTAISAILIGMFVPTVGAESGTSYSFNFVGPNLTMRAYGLNPPTLANPATGMYIEPGAILSLVGGVTFDPSTGTVSGGGSYMHYAPDGTKYAKGIWEAESFVSFVSDGGPSPGQQSGVLTIIVKATRLWSEYPGFEHVKDVKMMKLMVSDEGFTLMGGPGYALPVFNEIESGNAHFRLIE